MRSQLSPKSVALALASFGFLLGCNLLGGGGGGGATPIGRPPSADYGDAPDGGPTGYPAPFAQIGQFPTLFASNGARALNTGVVTLGPLASAEVDAVDPADPDGITNLTNTDFDDGLVDLFITLVSIPPPATLTVNVSAPAGSSGGTFLVNAVIDLNMDGRWGGQGASGESEWVVRNEPVDVVPGVVTPFTSKPFAFSNGNLVPDGAFMRIALTSEPAPSNWDGTGEFSSGEIEDHFIKLPMVNGKKMPILSVDCGGPYRPLDQVTCVVTNLRADAGGTFNYALQWLSGGTVNVPIGTCAPAAPVAIGPNAAVPITCNSTSGSTPTSWLFTAQAQDPQAQVVEGGIVLGHSDASTSAFEFAGEPKEPVAFLALLQAGIEHHSGFSNMLLRALVLGADPQPIAGADVTLTMTSSDGSTESITATTDGDGVAAGAFTIYSYGGYSLTVDSVEAEGYVYAHALNIADALQVDVSAEETSVLASDRVRAFYEALNEAFLTENVEFLVQNLHPAILEVYGVDACRAHFRELLPDPPVVETIGVTGFGSWVLEHDGYTVAIDNAYAVLAEKTVGGQTEQDEVHLALRDDASLGWFADCGEPLA